MKKNLVIKSNNCSCKEPCAICGEVDSHADSPYAVFLEGTFEAVCARCVNKHAPQLGQFIKMGNRMFWKKQEKLMV